MDNKKIITIFFPTFFITIVTIILSLNNFKFTEMDFKGLDIVALVLLFPLFFIIQGIISATNNTNILLSLGTSTIAFITLNINKLSSDIFIYFLVYLIFGTAGYLITKGILRFKEIRKYK